MKKSIFNILVFILFTFSFHLSTVSAQAPKLFKYQAVVRGSSGNVIANQLVNFRISILKASVSGPSVYTETQSYTTNAYGLVNMVIGNGTLVSGNFNTIDWGGYEHFVKIEFDVTGGTNFVEMGTSQLLSVPYALYSEASGEDGGWVNQDSIIYLSNLNARVGIGTNNPTAQLTIRNPNMGETDTTGTVELLFDSRGYGPSTGGKIVFEKEITNCGGLKFFTQHGYGTSVERMCIKANGNVGIGTSNPTAQLCIRNPDMNETDPNGTIELLFDSRGYGPSTGGKIVFEKEITNCGGLKFFTQQGYGTSIERMSINAAGNVGIGTSNPTYKLSVNGTIRAKEVIVNTGWSDFVFEKDYKLLSLAELEKFINKNKHLPDVPTAKEVEDNGVSLGNFNSKLLQKVEELTLYIIEQNKKIELLNDKIEKLEKTQNK